MDWSTRQAALRTVAKLAWGGSTMALACSGATVGTHPGGSSGESTAAGRSSSATGGAEPELRPQPASGSAGAMATTTGGATVATGGSPSPNTGAATSAAAPSMGGAGGQAEESSAGAGGAGTAECTSSIALEPDNVATVSIPEEELACCVAQVLVRLEEADAKTDPAVINCCTAIVLGSNSSSPHYGSPVRAYCCSGGVVAEPKDLFNLPYCTPWGPPVPPSLPAVMA